MQGVPVLILKEGTERARGRDARENNIMAVRALADAVRSSLGPRGQDKMLVDSLGDVTITNDGATILDEIEVQHPAAKMLVQVAKAQDAETGDGTTSAVVVCGELLKQALGLITSGVHPTVIISGYRKAVDKATEVLDGMSVECTLEDRNKLLKVVETSIASKLIAEAKDFLAPIAVDSVLQITEETNSGLVADIDHIKVEKKEGGSVRDTQLVRGVIVDKEIVHSEMPRRVSKAKIALVNASMEVEKTEMDAEIRITDPEQMKSFLDEEQRMLKSISEKVKATGANVVFAQKGIDDKVQHYLAKDGIIAVRRIKKSDMEALARATGGSVVSSIDHLTEAHLGACETVEERKVGDDKMVFVEGCKDPKTVSVLIRGGTERVVDEAERAFHDAVSVVRDAVEDAKIVPGGGAPEVEVASQLREYAGTLKGREQIAVNRFADAMEIIPKTLAENAGHDPIDVIVALRADHGSGKNTMGVDIHSGKSKDMMKAGVLEPLRVKTHAVRSATEAASLILRIDDVIASKRSAAPPGGPGMGGMPPGMGGMGGMPPGMM
ncbi:MAG: thermosome subunit beta [Candidatus Hermodarchaeota archaeon]|nr:thermosome subunit beta [Candidatus Hermodarchaeota archaeon]